MALLSDASKISNLKTKPQVGDRTTTYQLVSGGVRQRTTQERVGAKVRRCRRTQVRLAHTETGAFVSPEVTVKHNQWKSTVACRCGSKCLKAEVEVGRLERFTEHFNLHCCKPTAS